MYFAEHEACKDLSVGNKNKQLAANTKLSSVNGTEDRPEERPVDSFSKDVTARHNDSEPDSMSCNESTNIRVFTGEWESNKFEF